jgi:hypothetical protein
VKVKPSVDGPNSVQSEVFRMCIPDPTPPIATHLLSGLQSRHEIDSTLFVKMEEIVSLTSSTVAQVVESQTLKVLPEPARATYRPAGDHLVDRMLHPRLIWLLSTQPPLALSIETTPLSPPIANKQPLALNATDLTGRLLVYSAIGTKKLLKTFSVSNRVTDPSMRPQARVLDVQL